MSTMKNPAQLAEEQMLAQDWHGAREAIIAAVEADRAQRAPAVAKIMDAAGKWSSELNSYVIPAAAESSAEDAGRYQDEMASIDAAILALTGETALEERPEEITRAKVEAYGNASRLPAEMNAHIDHLCASRGVDCSVYVLDGQTAEHTEIHGPDNDGGDCYHDALLIIDAGDGRDLVDKLTMYPSGVIVERRI